MLRGIRSPLYAYYGGHVLRKIWAMAPQLGLVPKPETLNRKPGVTAIVRARNEPYIHLSLLSIKGFVDEIIVVDSSTDDTPERVRRVADATDLNIRYTHKVCNLREAYQLALRQSTCEWCLKWDADFIAYEARLPQLKKALLRLSKTRYYVIEFPLLCLTIDFTHISEAYPYQAEGWLFRFSPMMEKFVERKHSFPRFFEKKYIGEVFALHLVNVKPPIRLLERKYQTRWMNEQNKTRYSNSFQEYVKALVKEDYGTQDVDAAANMVVSNLLRVEKTLVYNKRVHGEYPHVIKDYLRDCEAS